MEGGAEGGGGRGPRRARRSPRLAPAAPPADCRGRCPARAPGAMHAPAPRGAVAHAREASPRPLPVGRRRRPACSVRAGDCSTVAAWLPPHAPRLPPPPRRRAPPRHAARRAPRQAPFGCSPTLAGLRLARPARRRQNSHERGGGHGEVGKGHPQASLKGSSRPGQLVLSGCATCEASCAPMSSLCAAALSARAFATSLRAESTSCCDAASSRCSRACACCDSARASLAPPSASLVRSSSACAARTRSCSVATSVDSRRVSAVNDSFSAVLTLVPCTGAPARRSTYRAGLDGQAGSSGLISGHRRLIGSSSGPFAVVYLG